MKLIPTWLPSVLAFYMGAVVPLIARFIFEDGVYNGIIGGAGTAIIPALFFAWALSNRRTSKQAHSRTCAVFGFFYGVGYIVVFYISLTFLTQQVTGYINVAHVVNAVYMFGVPWVLAMYASGGLKKR